MDDLISRLRLAEAEATEQEAREFARSRAKCLQTISFNRASQLAFARSSSSKEEEQHLRTCWECSSRILSFERVSHPTRGQLFLLTKGMLDDADLSVIADHVKSCASCRSLGSAPAAEYLLRRLRGGWETIEAVRRKLDAHPIRRQLLPPLELRYASADEGEGAFSAYFEDGALCLRLTQHGEQLSANSAIDNAHSPFRSVMVDVTGAGSLISGLIRLENREGVWVGGTTLNGFHRLLKPNGEIRFGVVPLEE